MPNPMMDRAPRFWKFAAAWALLIFLLSSIPGAAFPASKLFSYDKLLHAGVYSVLGAFCFMAIPRRFSRKSSVLVALSCALATLYGFTDEFHQLFVPGRSADLRDVLADCVGGLAGALIASILPLGKAMRGEPKADGAVAKSNRAS
jgi:VanZ family protein